MTDPERDSDRDPEFDADEHADVQQARDADRETADTTRDLGVEFGDLEGILEDEEYPITGEELIEKYGDHTLDMSGGEQTLRDILEPVAEQEFQDVGSARQTIVGFVDREAVGRPRYSDRDPPGLGEEAESDEESF